MTIGIRSRSLTKPVEFFTAIRAVIGSLSAPQVATINALLAAAGAAGWSTGWLAYGLATAWHEAKLVPIREWGLGKNKPYGKRGKYGQAQYGRGLVQLTWDFNYEWADKALGLGGTLLRNFDRALEPEIATRILILGMEQGAFTGRKLGQYIADLGTREAFVAARRIINGTDRADDIAEYALKIQAALTKGRWV